MERIICLVIGYVFGLFQTAYIYGKLHGIDIRDYGSGNAGTTNTMRVLGTKAGLLVLLCDIVKCILAVVVTDLIFGESHPDMLYLLKIYAATGAILGHNFPFYLHFKGGKGIAATAGMILSFHPYLIPMGVILFFGAFFTTHYVSLGSLLVYAGFFIELIVLGQMDIFGMPQNLLIEMYIIAGVLTVMAYYKHKDNIKRLLSGTERKTYLTHKNRDGQGSQNEAGKADRPEQKS
ncbi:MAG: glycerol-3-phosphate 1-O-acyltransferase PlsY [Lachnospiraceae bacterium]|nr:glycerol-3-phosphate 1-O-acyltransferase PlsY [Lachnospiraceae bacterium]